MYRATESGVDPAQKEKPMRKMIMLAAATALAVVVGSVAANSAAAKTVTVTITKNGYVPNSLTIAQGDTVQFTNSDTVAPPGHVQVDRRRDLLAEPAGAAANRWRQLHVPERGRLFVLRSEREGQNLQGHDHRHRRLPPRSA